MERNEVPPGYSPSDPGRMAEDEGKVISAGVDYGDAEKANAFRRQERQRDVESSGVIFWTRAQFYVVLPLAMLALLALLFVVLCNTFGPESLRWLSPQTISTTGALSIVGGIVALAVKVMRMGKNR